jgi:hypothetical protein
VYKIDRQSIVGVQIRFQDDRPGSSSCLLIALPDSHISVPECIVANIIVDSVVVLPMQMEAFGGLVGGHDEDRVIPARVVPYNREQA